MSYLNPFQFIEPPLQSLEEYQSSMIKKAKQRLLAEFELDEQGMPEINGQHFDKSEVLACLEELELKPKRELHWYIFSEKPLLSLLSNPTLALLQEVELEKYRWLGPEMIELMRGALLPSFPAWMKTATLEKQSLQLQSILKCLWLLPAMEADAIFQPLIAQIEAQIMEHRDFIANSIRSKSVSKPRLDKIRSPYWVVAANALPETHQALRDEFALSLGHLGNKLETLMRSNALPQQLVTLALSINCTAPTKMALFRWKRDTNQENSRQESPRRFKKRYLALILVPIIAFIWFARHPNHDFDHSPSGYSPSFSKGSSSSSYHYSEKSSTSAYENLLAALKEKAIEEPADSKEKQAQRPETKDSFYKQFKTEGKSGRNIFWLHIRNETEKDMVIFEENLSGELLEAKYLRAKETLEIPCYGSLQYMIYGYSGEEWTDSLTTVKLPSKKKTRKVPGFKRNVDFVADWAQVGKKAPVWMTKIQEKEFNNVVIRYSGAKFEEVK